MQRQVDDHSPLDSQFLVSPSSHGVNHARIRKAILFVGVLLFTSLTVPSVEAATKSIDGFEGGEQLRLNGYDNTERDDTTSRAVVESVAVGVCWT